MPTSDFSAASIKRYLKIQYECLSVLLEFLTVLLESIDIFGTVNDITQKKFGGAPPPCSSIPSLPLGS